ncbi:MAG: extracellular solute-binding protein, partial [Anaerolineae bacterium]|nr:extracellular solute-binding protein [Anaerolineae bacterium]
MDVNQEEKQIVVLWHNYMGVESKALQAIADNFNAENNQNLLLITEYQQDIFDKLQVGPEARPDLVTLNPEDLPPYINVGLIGPGPEQSLEFQQHQDDMLPMAADLYEVNGVMMALPLGIQTYVIYSNRDWLRDLGYPMENASWQDLQRVA